MSMEELTQSSAQASLGSNFRVDAIEDGLIERILAPYKDHCRYLKKAFLQQQDSVGPGSLVCNAEFAIPESCYIDDTGHFNAVEFNICYNQLTYVFLGYAICNRLIPELHSYSEDTFFRYQLSHYLIANLRSGFKAQINPRRFYGTYRIKSIRARSKCIFVQTTCAFNDDEGGSAEGDILLAILYP